MSKKYEIDMCNGPILGKLLKLALPMILSSVLQLLFNAADIIVVGKFAGDECVAAVGSTTSLINLIVNLFIGLSVGAGVTVAHALGGNQAQEVHRTVHTALPTALVGGVLLAVISKFCDTGEVNERLAEIRYALPGANCGACGYAGCDSYAEAVENGSAEPNLCAPGGKDTALKLSEILGVEIELTPKVARVQTIIQMKNSW